MGCMHARVVLWTHSNAVRAEGGMDVHDSVSSQHGLANGHAHGLADSQDVGLSSPSSNGIGAGGVSAQPPAANSGLQVRACVMIIAGGAQCLMSCGRCGV